MAGYFLLLLATSFFISLQLVLRKVQVSLIYNDIVVHVAPASAPIGNDGIRTTSDIAERESTMFRTELFRMVRTVATNGLTAVASCIGG